MKTVKIQHMKRACVVRGTSLILVILMLFAAVPVYARDIHSLQTEQVPLYQEGAITVLDTEMPKAFSRNAMATFSLSTVQDVILQGLENVDREIDISEYEIPVSELRGIYSDIVNSNPQLFYVTGNYSYSYDPDVGTIVGLLPKYNCTIQEVLERRPAFNRELEKALTAIPKNVSDAEKVLAVNDYIAYNTEYDMSLSKFSAYDVFVEKTAVCQGYALAFNLLMKELGMESKIVPSDPMAHAWNLVQVDGAWYHVDVTWNDPTPDQLGNVRHNFLLISDDLISDAEHLHFGWPTDSLPAATDETYQDYFWGDVNTAMIYHEGLWYYIPISDGLNHSIMAYDFAESEFSTIHTVSTKWSAEGNTYWIRTPFIGKYESKLYYNTADKIFKMNFDGTGLTEVLREEVTGTDAIYEMIIRDNFLYYRVVQSDVYIDKSFAMGSSAFDQSYDSENLQITAPENVIPTEGDFSVTPKVSEDADAAVKTKFGDTAQISKFYDIFLTDASGNEIQPSGEVTLKFKIDAENPKDFKFIVVNIDEDGTITELLTTVNSGYAFSTFENRNNYALIQIERSKSFLCGDVNRDDEIDDRDVILLARSLAGWKVADIFYPEAADIDGSGAVDDKDAITFARYFASWKVTTKIGELISAE